MRIAIVTDCWLPQIDGIVRTLEPTVRELRKLGHDVLLLTPLDFLSVPLPYGDRLVLPSYLKLSRRLGAFGPNTVHLATQGVLGLTALAWCKRHRAHYTTAFHTRFPEYAKIRYGLPEWLLYRYARFFHGNTAPVLVPSRALADYLTAQGLGQPKLWTRGVDTEQFCPRPKLWTHLPRPIHLYVGRLVAEKNVKAFLDTETSGTKLVVGAGPALAGLRQSYPDTTFLGALEGEPLARAYSEADVFVFPSLLDTFGLVVLEALASGVPIAAFPTPHLVEIFGPHEVIAFNDSLAAATRHALDIPSARCRETALRFSWRACIEQFVHIVETDMRQRGWKSAK